jgi:diadenosine tetraphosphate (Ap4A) HIT family hydrolase
MDYNLLLIKSYQYWEVYLHENQCFLGRTFVLLKDDKGVDDFIAISPEARDEFFKIGAEVKQALQVLFQPDKMNYAALSNTSPKIHVHLVPRYKDSRTFGERTYVDSRWGKNFAPYDKEFKIEIDELINIKDTIKGQL